jgi:hypothetical protein
VSSLLCGDGWPTGGIKYMPAQYAAALQHPQHRSRGLAAVPIRRGFLSYDVQVSKPHCEECERLWEIYEKATLEHMLLDEAARGSHSDLTNSRRAVLKAEAAERWRTAAQEAILAHRAATGHV